MASRVDLVRLVHLVLELGSAMVSCRTASELERPIHPDPLHTPPLSAPPFLFCPSPLFSEAQLCPSPLPLEVPHEQASPLEVPHETSAPSSAAETLPSQQTSTQAPPIHHPSFRDSSAPSKTPSGPTLCHAAIQEVASSEACQGGGRATCTLPEVHEELQLQDEDEGQQLEDEGQPSSASSSPRG